MLREIRKKAAVYGVLAVLLATVLGAVCLNFGIRPLLHPPKVYALNTFSSYEELENYLKTNQKPPYYQVTVSDLPRTPFPSGAVFILGGTDVKTLVPQSGPEYSVTNVQVAGVDEADLVKTDGEYMYVVSGNNVTILKAYPAEDAKILSQISLNGTLRGIFINGDRLAVFGESYFYQPVEVYYTANVSAITEVNGTIWFTRQQVRIAPYNLYSTSGETFIKVYNVSDRNNPSLTREVTINGTYFSSRMIGDYAYAVTNEPTLWRDSRVILPVIVSMNETKTIQPNEIYYSNASDNSYAFTTIVAINLKLDDSEPVHKTFLLGSASCMYASLSNIYITMPKYEILEASSTETTLVYRVHMQDGEIEWEASGEIPGRLLNQFSMDEYGEYFRVATTIGQTWNPETPSRNNIYVLNMSLSIIGKLENLAPTETIYATRFIGDRCYLVTFRQVDPFFVIDLQNPYDPKVLGTLKIPGYSSYLHPYDENHIIGVGKDEGKVKISLFDVSNVSAPKEKAKYATDRQSDSLALDDHKALLFDRLKNLLVMPITEYKDYAWQGAYVFNISMEGIVLRGQITHMGNDTGRVGFYYYYYPQNYVTRAFYIEDILYTVSNKKIKMNDLETLQEIKEVELP